MALEPITIKNVGDRKLRLADHAVVIVGIDAITGQPFPFTALNLQPAGAGENHIGEVSSPADLITVTPTLDTSIYASGDTLFNSTTIANAVRVAGGQAVLQSLVVIDKDDQGIAMDIYIFDTTGLTFGTLNNAPSISAANAAKILGIISIASGDWKDVGNAKVAAMKGVGLLVEAASGRNLAVAAVTGGTPTHTASGLVLRFGFLW